ncbi:MAG: 50S ribosomal protein L11 methyltransferase [Lachnospiraceae bacterium]|nr:50S ribosomal protein L11 methyltransferase [Lachnospiraceae bacterium]
MKWTRIRIKTITDAEDIIISELYDLGLEGAQIEDKVPLTAWEKEQMFVDILPESQADDGIAYLSFFVEEGSDLDIDQTVSNVKDALDGLRQFMDIGEGSIEVDETEDLDWINNWKQYFHQFYIDDLLVIPSWEEVSKEDKDRMILRIDPGTAFGTGLHDTTQLCVKQMKKYITKESEVLDVGTGSGILAILAIMYGAKHAFGTDLDPCAVNAVNDNMAKNNIDPDRFEMIIGNIIDDRSVQDKAGYECYDIVLANILAGVLVDLTPVIVSQMKKGAVYITSGIINDGDKEHQVKDAMEKAGLKVIDVSYQGEWVSVTGKKE